MFAHKLLILVSLISTSESVLSSICIKVPDAKNKASWGSGTIISSSGLGISCEHIFRDRVSNNATVYYPNGSRTLARLIALDTKNDLSLFKVSSESILSYICIPKSVPAGTPYLIGYPRSKGPKKVPSRFRGYYANAWSFAGYNEHGMSGGGIFIKDTLVSINTGMATKRNARKMGNQEQIGPTLDIIHNFLERYQYLDTVLCKDT